MVQLRLILFLPLRNSLELCPVDKAERDYTEAYFGM